MAYDGSVRVDVSMGTDGVKKGSKEIKQGGYTCVIVCISFSISPHGEYIRW